MPEGYTHEQLVEMLGDRNERETAINYLNSLVPREVIYNGAKALHRAEMYCRFDNFKDRPFAYWANGAFHFLTKEEAIQSAL